MIGQVVSHYRVLRELGGGGMGVVYEAEDTRLGRHVALKFLTEEHLREASARERFTREARAASSLNHPNICTIFDIGEHDGRPFIAMELLKGASLAIRIHGEAIGIGELLHWAIQVADALDATHASGIIHRDVKPGNVLITTRGDAKVLDFGIARVEGALLPVERDAETATEQPLLTRPGVTAGTLAYMSPEQALGKPLDARSDLFSLGVVLFEMATGRRPVEGDSAAALSDRILNERPSSPLRLNPRLPDELGRIVLKCLEKDRDMRYQSARELLADLRRLERDLSTGAPLPERDPAPALLLAAARARRARIFVIVTAALVAMAAVGLTVLRPRSPAVPRITDYTQITADRVDKYVPWFRASPATDGTRIYFNEAQNAGSNQVVQAAATGGEVVPVPLPIRGFPILLDASRDGTELLVRGGFEDGPASPGELWAVPTVGGALRRVGDLRVSSAAWAPDRSRIAFTRDRDVFVAAADGSNPRTIWSAADFAFSPAWSPDGHRLRVSVSEEGAITLGRSSLWEVDVQGRAAHPLLPQFKRPACCGRWMPDGRHFVFEAGDRRRDLWVLSESGIGGPAEPVRLTQGPMQFLAPVPAPDGRSLYAIGWRPLGELVRIEKDPEHAVPYLGGLSVQELDFSRDGRWVTYSTFPEGDVWRSRVDGTDRLQLTFPPLEGHLPRWSPDGTQIAFAALAPGRRSHIRLVPARGGTSREVLPSGQSHIEASWSSDGRSLALGSLVNRPEHPIAIERVDLDTGRLSKVPGSEGLLGPRWSPDGRLLAALSYEQDRLVVIDLESGRSRTLLSSTGVGWPTWSGDGRYLFVDGEKAQLRVRVADGRCDTLASTTGLRRAHYSFSGEWAGVTPDGAMLALRDVSVNEIFALSWIAP